MRLISRILLVLMVISVSSCSYLRDWRHLPVSEQDKKHIYVVSHGWHTGLVVAKKNLSPQLGFLDSVFAGGNYYEIGWGDKGFYQANEITSGLTIKAMLWPSESVMHVVSLTAPPDKVFPHSDTVKITISSAGHKKLNDAIAASFDLDQNGDVAKTRKGLYGDSQFFKANGYFFLTNTCNTWTSTMLYEAGLPMSTFLTLTASSVMRQAENAIQREAYRP